MHAFFLQPGCQPLLSALEWVDKDCILGGLGEQAFEEGEEAVKRALCARKKQMKDLSFQLLDEWYKEIPIDQNLAMVYGSIHIAGGSGSGCKAGAADEKLEIQMCVSALFERKESWRLSSLHLSVPCGEELPGCFSGTLAQRLRETRRMLAYMRRLAEQDPVTSLYNRRAFFTMAEQLIQRENCYMMVLDLDHFKLINDTYGHLMGDDILHWTGKAICAAVRKDDVVGRVGGDEFAVMCAEVQTDQMAMDIAWRIVKNVNQMTGKSISMPVNISVGVARHQVNNILRETFRQADAAMYQVKRSCKNGCLLYGAETACLSGQEWGKQDV